MIKDYEAQILYMWNEGDTVTDICNELNLHPASVYAYMSYHRDVFPKRVKHRRISEDESLQMHNEYLGGLMVKEIAEKHNVCTATVARHIAKHW